MSKEESYEQSQDMCENDSEEIEVVDGQDGSPGMPGHSSEELNNRASHQESVDHASSRQQERVQIENQEEEGDNQDAGNIEELNQQRAAFMNTGQSFGDINAGQRSSQRERLLQEEQQQQLQNQYQDTFQM